MGGVGRGLEGARHAGTGRWEFPLPEADWAYPAHPTPTWPTRRSPVLVKATTEGVVRPPSALVMIVGLPPSMAATAELVVPRSMPTTCRDAIEHTLNQAGLVQQLEGRGLRGSCCLCPWP